MGGDLVVNILDRISKLAEAQYNVSTQLLTSVKKSNDILSKVVVAELRTQTSLLTDIKAAIKDQVGVSITKSKFVLFQDSGTESFAAQVQNAGIDNDSLSMLAKNIDDIATAYGKFVEEVDKLNDKKLSKIKKHFIRMTIIIFILSKVVKRLIDRTTTFFQSVTATLTVFAVVTTLLAPVLFFTTAIIIPLIYLWAKAFMHLAKSSKKIEKGAKAILMIGVAVAVLSFATTIAIVGAGGPVALLIHTAVIIITIFALVQAFRYVSKNGKVLKKASIVVGMMAISIGLLALAIYGFVKAGSGGTDPIALLMTSIAVGASVAIIGFAMYLLGKVNSDIIKGAFALLIGSAALYVLSSAMQIWTKADIGIGDIGLLLLTIAGLGGALFIMGLMAPLIILGSLSLLFAGIGILALASGMKVWVEASVIDSDIESLEKTLTSVGYSIAKWGLMSPLIILGSLSLIIFSAGLYTFTAGLRNYKTVNWMESDSESLVESMSTILTGFVKIFEKMSFEMIFKALAGAALLGELGNSLSAFATGLAAMAELQVPTYEVKDGKLVLTGTKQLDADFAQKVADNISTMINALVVPLATLGEQGDTFSNGPVGTGIELLGNLGNSLGQFATGVAAMAKLQVPTYEVKDGKLVLVGTKQLDPDFAQQVSDNITMIVGSLMEPMRKLGEESGMFSDGPVGTGIELLGNLGNSLGAFAEGVAAMAELQVPTYEVKDGKLTLTGTKQLDSDFAAKVAQNINTMIAALTTPLVELGSKGALFSDGPLKTGVETLGALGNSLSAFAQGVAAMAELKVPTYEVKDGKLVLTGTKQISKDFAEKVSKNITNLIDALVKPLEELGDSSGDFEDGIELLGKLGNPLQALGKGVESFSKLDATTLGSLGSNIGNLITNILGGFDTSKGYSAKQSRGFSLFATTFQTFSVAAKSLAGGDKLSSSMVEVKNAINGMDMKKLAKLNELMFNFRKLSENLKGSFDDLSGVLDKLIEVVQSMNDSTSNIRIAPGAAAQSARIASEMPSHISVDNLDEVTRSINELKNVLLGTIDVHVENTLIN